MNAKRFFFVTIGFLVLLIVGTAGTAVLASDYLKKQSVRVSDMKVDQAVLAAQESSYTKARNDLKKYESLQASIEKILPKDKDQARAVLELFSIAAESDIRISQINFASSDLGKTPAKTTTTPDAGADASKTAPATTPAAAAASITQAKPVDGISGVQGIAASIEVEPVSDARPITYVSFLSFLKKLENNRRTMQVSQVTITPVDKTKGGKFDFSVNLTFFVKP